MALTPIEFQKKAKPGGGSVGAVLGGIAGLVAAPFTGGATLPAAAAGLGIGTTVGGLAGGAVAPGKAGGQGVQLQQSAIARRAEQEPEDHSQILEQSLAALKDTTPEIQEAYGAPLMKAYEMSRKRGGYA